MGIIGDLLRNAEGNVKTLSITDVDNQAEMVVRYTRLIEWFYKEFRDLGMSESKTKAFILNGGLQKMYEKRFGRQPDYAMLGTLHQCLVCTQEMILSLEDQHKIHLCYIAKSDIDTGDDDLEDIITGKVFNSFITEKQYQELQEKKAWVVDLGDGPIEFNILNIGLDTHIVYSNHNM